MLVLFAALALLAGPPHATIDGVPLAVSSWCWGTKCGAPIAASAKTAVAPRDSTVRIDFGFDPTQVRVAIAGKAVTVAVHGHEATWRARAAGGLTVSATGARGWVTYVGRLRVR